MDSTGVRVIVDASAGVEPIDGRLTVVLIDGRSDAHTPSRKAFLDAFAAAAEHGPFPVLCLVGPYGYAPTHTAANGARKDLSSRNVDPEGVRVLNVGRTFLGLGLLARALATSTLKPEAAMQWLDEAAPATAVWVVAGAGAVESAPPEAMVEDLPSGGLDAPWALLRVRSSSKVVAGFDSPREALSAAIAQSAVRERGCAAISGGLGLDDSVGRALAPSLEWRSAAHPEFLTTAFGECAAVAIGPKP